MLVLGALSVVVGVVGFAGASVVVLFTLIVELDIPELDDCTAEETGSPVEDGVTTDGDTAGDAVVLGVTVVLPSEEMVPEALVTAASLDEIDTAASLDDVLKTAVILEEFEVGTTASLDEVLELIDI